MRLAILLIGQLAFLGVAVPAVAADKMLPRDMEVGKVGPLWPDGVGLVGIRGEVVKYTIIEVGDEWLALRVTTGETDQGPDTIIVRGIPTKGLVDGKRWKPTGTWKVEKTEKYKSKTVFSLRPDAKK